MMKLGNISNKKAEGVCGRLQMEKRTRSTTCFTRSGYSDLLEPEESWSTTPSMVSVSETYGHVVQGLPGRLLMKVWKSDAPRDGKNNVYISHHSLPPTFFLLFSYLPEREKTRGMATRPDSSHSACVPVPHRPRLRSLWDRIAR